MDTLLGGIAGILDRRPQALTDSRAIALPGLDQARGIV